jgi:hypothetical protein
MLRWLIIVSLFAYVLYKFGFFRSLSSGYNEKQRKPPNSNVNVDNAPPKEKKRSAFKGGDYVDYEEIK